MFDPLSIFEFQAGKCAEGRRCVLVTIAAVTGSSTREAGAMMAVCEDGAMCGSVSGGCLEKAIAAEALDVLASATPRLVRFGAGSHYIDIRLPCGGSIDLLFSPILEDSIAVKARDTLARRQPLTLRLGRHAPEITCSIGDGSVGVWMGDRFVEVRHVPRLRLVVLGTGEVVAKLCGLAQQVGIDVIVGSPDEHLLKRIPVRPAEARLLKSPTGSLALDFDMWTAAALMFHDHDWEPHLLSSILAGPAFFVGAMGSRKTHEARLLLLAQIGVDPAHAARIASPIGLIHAMRDPETLAVSVLAQVIGEFNRRYLAKGAPTRVAARAQ